MSLASGLLGAAKDVVVEVAASTVADVSAAAQTAAADKAALGIDEVFGLEKELINEAQPVVIPEDPELGKVKAPAPEAKAPEKTPVWLMPAVVVVAVVLCVVAFSAGIFGKGKKKVK